MRVYIVAGEPSGDLLASGLMRALLRLRPDVRFCGVGGESMMAVEAGSGTDRGVLRGDGGGVSGSDLDSVSDVDGVSGSGSGGRFRSLFDIAEISVMGIFEVLPRLPLILRRLRQTVADIEAFEPDVLVTVDSWGFVSALLSRLRKKWRRVARSGQRGARKFPVVHYVAPQVWAWKKGRAKNVARLVDRLMTLMPDEGRWFEPYGLQCDFVGHPVVERVAEATLDAEGFRASNGIPAGATVISVLPGSRHSEVRRLLPVFRQAVERVVSAQMSGKGLFVVVPTVPGVEDEVRRGFENATFPVLVVTGEADRYNAFAVSSLAISKSGTVSLELAAFGVPHLIAYTFGRFGDVIAERLVKVRFADLINLLADREIIPEFVLRHCRPEPIAECAFELLQSPKIAEKQLEEAHEVMQKLRLPDVLPSDRAAQIVLEMATSRSHEGKNGTDLTEHI